MAEPVSIQSYYFCPAASASPTSSTGSKEPDRSSCVPFENKDGANYNLIKLAYSALMKTLSNLRLNLKAGMIYETAVIAWLVNREIGYSHLPEYIIKEIFTVEFERLPMKEFRDPSDRARVKFWRAKVGLILATDIDNPHSREFINLKFKRSGKPVFGVALPQGKIKSSNSEKMDLLKQLYESVIKTSGDPLLEAECLMAQFELRATDPANPNLQPSQTLDYLKSKIEETLKVKTYSKYIKNRIPDTGYNVLTGMAYWSGTKMRGREVHRFIAQALKLKAQLTLLAVHYNDPLFEQKIQKALEYMQNAQSLADKYIEDPAKAIRALNRVFKQLGIKQAATPKEFRKSYGDLLNLLSIEQMKATAHYKLGLHFQFSDLKKSQAYFKKAEEISKNTNRILESIKRDYEFRKDRSTKEGKGKYWKKNILFWRSIIQGSAKTMLANTYLAQDKNIEESIKHLKECINDPDQLIRGEEIIRVKLALVDAILRKKQATYDGQVEKVRSAKIALAQLIDNSYDPATLNPSPYIKSLKGSIRLAQAKVLLAKFYLDDSQLDIAEKVVEILDEQIAKARPGGNFAPTPTTHPPDVRPNNGVFEDYELATALQIRGEAHLALDNFKQAIENFKRALEVYKDAKDLSLNYFPKINLGDIANWRGNYKEADKYYKEFQSDFKPVLADSPILKNAKLRTELGSQEIILREKALHHPGKDFSREATKVIQTAKRVLQESDELFLIERALASIIEGLYAKKDDGKGELVEFRDKLLKNFDIAAYLGKKTALKNIGLKPAAKASLTLKSADGFLFVHEYEEAKRILENFKADYSKLFNKKRVIEGHHLLTTSEIEQRLNSLDLPENIVQQMETAAKIIFSLKGQKRDPYLISRVIKSLVDTYVTKKEFEKALAILFVALELNPKYELSKLGGKLDDDDYDQAASTAYSIFQNLKIKGIFESKGLELKFDLLDNDLQIKLAEVLTWTKNYKQAKEVIASLSANFNMLKDLQQSRVLLVKGNLAAQWRKKRDYSQALEYYFQARDILNNLKEDPEIVMVKTELSLNIANVYCYGKDAKSDVRNPNESLEYYREAEALAWRIKGNERLKYYHLARIYFGRAQLRWQRENKDRIKAIQNLEKAREFAGIIKDKELDRELDGFAAFLLNPYLSVKREVFMDGQGRVENRTRTKFEYPLAKGRFVPGVEYRWDEAEGYDIHSVYLTAKGRPLEKGPHSIIVEGKIKLPFLEFPEKKRGAEMKFYRRPDGSLSVFYSNENMYAGGVAELYFKESEYNSYYATFMVNITDNLLAGAEYNHYFFTYPGAKKVMDDLNGAFRYTLDLAETGLLDDYNQVKLRFYLGWPYVQYDETEGKILYNDFISFLTSAKLGVGADIHLGKRAVLSVDCSVVRQSDYTYGQCSAEIRY